MTTERQYGTAGTPGWYFSASKMAMRINHHNIAYQLNNKKFKTYKKHHDIINSSPLLQSDKNTFVRYRYLMVHITSSTGTSKYGMNKNKTNRTGPWYNKPAVQGDGKLEMRQAQTQQLSFEFCIT
jgi:hypothetical protein